MLRYINLTNPNYEIDKNHKIRNGFGPGLRPDVWESLLDRFGKIHFAELYGSSEGVVGLYNIDPDDVGFICRFSPLLQERKGLYQELLKSCHFKGKAVFYCTKVSLKTNIC